MTRLGSAIVTLLVFIANTNAASYWTVGSNATLTVNIHDMSDYNVTLGDDLWLTGGPPNVWCNGQYYSPLNAVNNRINNAVLQPQSPTGTQTNGVDLNLGAYSSLEMEYKLISNANSNSNSNTHKHKHKNTNMLGDDDNPCHNRRFKTIFSYYATYDVFAFTQVFPDGLAEGTAYIPQFLYPPSDGTPTAMIPNSEFPVFEYADAPASASLLKSTLSYIEWQGRFMHDRSSHGIGLAQFEGGNEGGPIVLFDEPSTQTQTSAQSQTQTQTPSNALVLSTMDQFMNGIFAIRTRRGSPDDENNDNSNSNCTLYPNTDFEQNDIQLVTNIKSVDACCTLCASVHQNCNVFSYIGDSGDQYAYHCYLKYNMRGKTANTAGHTSGVVGAAANAKSYLVAGLEGNVSFVPENYAISFMLAPLKAQGIHRAMYKWGSVLQQKYQSTKIDVADDLTLSTLGYWTDNGGYFYGGNPLTTAIATNLFAYFRRERIPVRYLQLDPFWYFGGTNGDVLVWEPNYDLFPGDGLFELYDEIEHVPLLLYSSYWTAGNQTQDYYNAKYPPANNSGPGSPLVFTDSDYFDVGWLVGPIAEPLGYNSSYAFYQLIVREYADIISGFEVDFMDFEYGNFPALVSGSGSSSNALVLNLSAQWTAGMNDALYSIYDESRVGDGVGVGVGAGVHNLSIQYCMSLPNYCLQSLMYPTVTSARASEDDFPGNHNRWQIAYTAMLLSPLNVQPFFDVIWTTAVQPGNKYNANSMDCEMQAVIVTMSNGPFGIGDNIGMTNTTIVGRAVRAGDGVLLHPSLSMTPIDAMYYSQASSVKPVDKNSEIWVTHAFIESKNVSGSERKSKSGGGVNVGVNAYYVLAVDVSTRYVLTEYQLYPLLSPAMTATATAQFYVYTFGAMANVNECRNGSNVVQECGVLTVAADAFQVDIETDPPPVNNPTHLHSWELFVVVRVFENGWTVFGELDKYVSVSPQRFVSIDEYADAQNSKQGVQIVVSGAPDESILVSFVDAQQILIQRPVEFDSKGSDQTITIAQ